MAHGVDELEGPGAGAPKVEARAPGMAEVEELLRSTIGLEPTSVGAGWTALRVRERIESTGTADLGAYLELLRSSRAEVAALAERMVVPETWFFRDEDPFFHLARHVASTRASTPAGRRMRILSLPCASGEEPYSIAMALLDGGVPCDGFWVDAVDLRQGALEQARRGIYGAHSFRGQVGGFRARYFTETGEGYLLSPRVRRLVRFARGNVLDPDFASTLTPYDVVSCRNLMIYLDPAARDRLRRVVAGLTVPGGLLISGKAETISTWGPQFLPLEPVSACVYRRVEVAARCSTPPSVGLEGRAHRASGTPEVARSILETTATEGSGRDSTSGQDRLEVARRLASQGDLESAEQECAAHLAVNGPCAACFVLLAAVASARGEVELVESLLGRALYLDPHDAEALALLAVDRQRRGDYEGERLVRERLRRVQARVVRSEA